MENSKDKHGEGDEYTHELIEKACNEFNNSVKSSLTLLNNHLNENLSNHYDGLEELSEKIAARINFLENNPSFLASLQYYKSNVKTQAIREFDEIQITLKEYSRRINEKLTEIEQYHGKLFNIIKDNGLETTVRPDESCLELATTEKVTIQKDAYLEELADNNPLKCNLFSDIPAEVQRRKAVEDLHSRLIEQLEATDSLEGFIKLMNRKPPLKRKMKRKEIEEKYADSLWFFPQKNNQKSKQSITSSTKSTSKNLSSCTCNLLVSSSQTQKIREKLGRTKLKCYDLLDDIEGKDLKPIKSEYPRRDHLYCDNANGEMKMTEAKTYLHRMMRESEKVWKKLLQPVSMNTKKIKEKKAEKLMAYLTAPTQKIFQLRPQSLIVMPVKVFYDNYPTKDTPNEKFYTPRLPQIITDLTKLQSENSSTKKAPLRNLPTKSKPTPPTQESPRKAQTNDHIVPLQRKQEMLEHLRGLKARNDNIQKNIQKAIDVIESKMIDLLASPPDSNSTEAFNAMEKEITNVLKMMNENDGTKQKGQGDKPEEKKVKKTRRLAKVIPDFVPGVDLPSSVEDSKKIADIEEGERLLNQVDNVIKKIDNIYTKFYDDGSKPKTSSPHKESTFNNVIEFFDGLKNIIETPPVEIHYKKYDNIGQIFQQAQSYCQTKIYHQIQFINSSSDNNFYVSREISSEPKWQTITDFDWEDLERRHKMTLETIYAIFFSTIFVALNCNYVA